jgi:hypothetical protein
LSYLAVADLMRARHGSALRRTAMSPQDSSGWKVTIAVAVIGLIGTLGVALIYNIDKFRAHDSNDKVSNDKLTPTPSNRPTEEAKVTPTATPCLITGTVYNDDDQKPVQNVRVRYYPVAQVGNSAAIVYLTTTKPNGTFSHRCNDIPPASFPLKLELTSPDWPGVTADTEDKIPPGGTTDLTFYVSLNQIHTSANANTNAGPRIHLLARRVATIQLNNPAATGRVLSNNQRSRALVEAQAPANH